MRVSTGKTITESKQTIGLRASGLRARARGLGPLAVRQLATLGVGIVGAAAIVSSTVDPAARRRVGTALQPAALPSAGHVVTLLAGLLLLGMAPKILRGMRAALPLAIAALATLSMVAGADPLVLAAAIMAVALALALVFGWHTFSVGSRNRPDPVLAAAAAGAWLAAYLAVRVSPLFSDRGRTIRRALHHAIRHVLAAGQLSGAWVVLVEVLIGAAAAISVLALRSLLRPAGVPTGHTDHEYRNARALVEQYGTDSLSRFILRPDKRLYFDGEGVLAYRLIGETAVVSGDPVAPEGQAGRVLHSFQALCHRQGWELVVWGASKRNLGVYAALGMRALCAGEEAFVDPARFTLEGRRVRKLRQSVHRLRRRGWQVAVLEGREIDERLSRELDAFEAAWRQTKRRVVGFAMGMGPFDEDPRPDDLYVLARAPSGELAAVMRFLAYRGGLSLDAMHRLGSTPNGLNEALICHALAYARERGIREVSLNYAGLAHLARDRSGHGTNAKRPDGAASRWHRLVLRVLRRYFQLDRLVRFDEKFLPEWRPRYLVYQSRAALPRSIVRVLQAEGYLPRLELVRPRPPARLRPLPRGLRPDAAR